MVEELKLVEEPKKVLAMHPKKFALWLFMVSIVMIFASLTSAYIVKRSDGEWLMFEFPSIFQISTAIILLSSASMQWAYSLAKNNEVNKLKAALILTVFLGISFLLAQLNGWSRLVEENVYFVGNPAGSFIYVFTGVHGFHLITGLIFIGIVIYSTFNYKVHSKNLAQIEMCTTYWHFLGGLWIYLFLFLKVFN